jgi:hypothetical protein
MDPGLSELRIECNVELCMTIVRELRGYGCLQGRDFDFAYIPAVTDWSPTTGTDRFSASYVEFTFKSELGEQCSTLIGLKYG